MRILISGDSHADVNHVKSLKSKIEKFGCEKIFVVGDYGFWPRDKGGIKFLDEISKLDVPVYFLAGNHEDWDMLEKHEKNCEYIEGAFIEVHPNSFYAPTGSNWTWDGVRFLAVGGAHSIDKNRRVKFVSWFPQETISEVDVAKSIDSGKIDVLLSHDSPASVDIQKAFINDGMNKSQNVFRNIVLDPETDLNRNRLQTIVDAVDPVLCVHGHWHLTYWQNVKGMKVVGLNCNANPDYFTVLDTRTLNEETETHTKFRRT